MPITDQARLRVATVAYEIAAAINNHEYGSDDAPTLEEPAVLDGLAHHIHTRIWHLSGVNPLASAPAAPPAERPVPNQPEPPAAPTGNPDPFPDNTPVDTTDWDNLPDEMKGLIVTALANLPGRAEITSGSKEELKWADCIFYNPDEWYDNRKDKKPNAPDFRHASIEDGNGRRIGLWLNGKAATPSWVHTLLPFRDQPDILRAGQPF